MVDGGVDGQEIGRDIGRVEMKGMVEVVGILGNLYF